MPVNISLIELVYRLVDIAIEVKLRFWGVNNVDFNRIGSALGGSSLFRTGSSTARVATNATGQAEEEWQYYQ
jgi:hypothetical protein